MPRTKSILFEYNILENMILGCYDCCQFLHSTEINWGALAPLQYAVNHKIIINDFTKWLEFLKDKFQIETKYEVIEKEVTGIFTYNQYIDFYKENKNNYVLANPRDQEYIGVIQRSRSCKIGVKNQKLYMNVYGGNPLSILPLIYSECSTKFLENKDLITKKIPFMKIIMPKVTNKNYNNLKYLYWYMIRFFYEYPLLASFMLDRQNELEKLILNKKIHWYNILIKITDIYGLANFACNINKHYFDLEIMKKVIKNYIKTVYVDNGHNYNRQEINLSNATSTYFNMDRQRPVCILSPSELRDTTTGHMIDECSNQLMSIIKNRLK